MAFPNTVFPAQSPEMPSKYGPFYVGSVRYLFLYYIGTDFDTHFIVRTSTDGATWTTAFDTTDFPLVPSNGPFYHCAQSTLDPTKIYIIQNNFASSGIVQVLVYDTVAATLTVLASPGFPPQLPGQALSFMVCYRPIDNSLVFCVLGDIYTDPSFEDHPIPSFAVYDIASDTWGAYTDLSFTDYPTVISWTTVLCGMVCGDDNVVHVFMQQITTGVPDFVAFFTDGSGNFFAPWYASTTGTFEAWGGGGGGGGGNGVSIVPHIPGGGGAAGEYILTSVPIIPIATNGPIVVGLGGAPDSSLTKGDDGGATSFAGASAGGGEGGSATGTGGSGPGAPGGDGYDDSGGDGGGGGGGATSNSAGTGTAGADGVLYTGPPGMNNGGPGGEGGTIPIDPGVGQGQGGAGGSWDPTDIGGAVGGNAGQPGGGGGGTGNEGLVAGAGGDGEYGLSIPGVQGTVYPSRLWQQAILVDNSLGTLSEISDGQFPMQPAPRPFTTPYAVPFDCVAYAGGIAITFSGVTATAGAGTATRYDNIEVGRAANADPLSFDLQKFSSGNSGTFVSPWPALSADGATVYCSYVSYGSTVPVFRYRTDVGAGFGPPSDWGPFNDGGTRLQGGVVASTNEVTFGTAGYALYDASQPE